MTTQRDKVLNLLAAAGPAGVSTYDFIYEHGITRAAAAVFDLKKQGHVISTVDDPVRNGKRPLARYVLHGAKLDRLARCRCTHLRNIHEALTGRCGGIYLASRCPCSEFKERVP